MGLLIKSGRIHFLYEMEAKSKVFSEGLPQNEKQISCTDKHYVHQRRCCLPWQSCAVAGVALLASLPRPDGNKLNQKKCRFVCPAVPARLPRCASPHSRAAQPPRCWEEQPARIRSVLPHPESSMGNKNKIRSLFLSSLGWNILLVEGHVGGLNPRLLVMSTHHNWALLVWIDWLS